MSRIAGLFVGAIDDDGFNAQARLGFAAIEARHALEIVGAIPFDASAMALALGAMAERADVIVAIGGQWDEVVLAVASRYPDQTFAIVQGSVSASNVGSVHVRQEQSAFLAGVAAAGLTRTGVVGHLSGHRVRPGLLGRAAFAAGVAYAGTGARLLTGFCGTQDDTTVAERWTEAEIEAGADVIFTMLNAARSGATRAARQGRARLIGNVVDWTERDPVVFVASALARIDVAVMAAVASARDGTLPGTVKPIGLETASVVGLAVGADVSANVRETVETARDALTRGILSVPTAYNGPEFAPPFG
jgi:basic membrane protein A and related proteins